MHPSLLSAMREKKRPSGAGTEPFISMWKGMLMRTGAAEYRQAMKTRTQFFMKSSFIRETSIQSIPIPDIGSRQDRKGL